MQQSVTETINATPETLWAMLQPARWHLWLAADGPLPRLESAALNGDTIAAAAADGQLATYRVLHQVKNTLLEYQLEHLDSAPYAGIQQINRLHLAEIAEGQTELTWDIEWQRDTGGWRDLLADWLINNTIFDMMDLSVWNLKLLTEETATDDPDDYIPADHDGDDAAGDDYYH